MVIGATKTTLTAVGAARKIRGWIKPTRRAVDGCCAVRCGGNPLHLTTNKGCHWGSSSWYPGNLYHCAGVELMNRGNGATW
jgi:hypothetical protein